MRDEFEVLGSPLLTYLLMRLMSEAASYCCDEAEQQSTIETMIKQPTRLYRSLTDLTVEKAGKAPFGDANDDEHQRMARERDADTLRRKLRLTAAAMSVVGQESLTRKEWEERLPQKLTANEDADDPFVKLMISFYFKGGHAEQGIEFAHKSFREYLFAEHIVETIKENVSQPKFELPSPHPLTDGPHRWQDFEQRDMRFEFSRQLACLLAPQWLSREVRGHLEALLELEVERSASVLPSETRKNLSQEFGCPTPKLSWQQWQHARDLLADLWVWWLHAIHLRPQFHYNRQGRPEKILPPYVLELLESEMRHKSNPLDESQPQPSITAADAHLGDGLILLTAHLHWLIAQAEGWQGQWPALINSYVIAESGDAGDNPVESAADKPTVQTQPGPRLCQTSVTQEGHTWIVFEPNGEPRTDEEANHSWHRLTENWRKAMKTIEARINVEIDRPYGPFPSKVLIRGADLRVTEFAKGILSGASLDSASFVGAFLHKAELRGANLKGARLDGAFLSGAKLHGANLKGAFLNGAYLNGTNLDGANLDGANLDGASLNEASLGKNHVFEKSLTQVASPSLAEVTGLTEKKLLSVHWLAEETILPEQFNEVKERILQRQRDWIATMQLEEDLELEPDADEEVEEAEADEGED